MPVILFLVLIGASAGLIATRVMHVKTDLVTTVVIGIAGALVGWLLLRFVFMLSGWIILAAAAVGGAIALLWIWTRARPK
jgi:uncharacterized membrane protein YeaQ/YmgE (transglycosylase-associated protein family)